MKKEHSVFGIVAVLSFAGVGVGCATSGAHAPANSSATGPVSDQFIADQKIKLSESAVDAGFGPQSPRDLDSLTGKNPRSFETAPAYTAMNLCNIHFHESAEHKGGEFTTYAGNGDGSGYQTGYAYSGDLSEAELAPVDGVVGASAHGDLVPGDTIEVHYVHSTAQVTPGPTLGSCLSDSIANPQLRVETQVYVLVNDDSALNFMDLTKLGEVNGYQQALNIPTNTGAPVQYAGSTTGPSYNETSSCQVSSTSRSRPSRCRNDVCSPPVDVPSRPGQLAHNEPSNCSTRIDAESSISSGL